MCPHSTSCSRATAAHRMQATMATAAHRMQATMATAAHRMQATRAIGAHRMQATRATAAHRMQAMRATAAHRMQAVRAVWSARRARGKRCSLSLLALLVQKYKYLRSSLEREEGAWQEVYSQFTCFTLLVQKYKYGMQAVRAVWSARRARGRRYTLSLLALLVPKKYKY